MNKKICAVAVLLLLGNSILSAHAKTILLIPQDDRPVSLAYTVSTAEKAGYTVLTPPAAYLSGKDFRGSPEQVWRWLQKNMPKADAAILSTDTLIYGGLVDSRKHNESLDTLMSRENRIKNLHAEFPDVPLYAFGTVMRTPYASGGGVEPFYYSSYGPALYRISGLQDKMDSGMITQEEISELLSLKLSIPSEYLQDWFKRRSKNMTVNRMLIRDTRDGIFTYFCEGHDDNSKHSQSALEVRYLDADATDLPVSKFGSFPGADQLALLLIARYHNDIHHSSPSFSMIYPLGRAEDTVPSYENQPIGETIEQHIQAVGGTIAKKNRPDIVLAVNTPIASTGESGQFSNFGMMKPSTTEFISHVKSVVDQGIPVSIVDVYFANGADNTLMNLLKKDNLLYKVTAYNGWNTASNTIGYAIAQAVLAPEMTDSDHQNMLTEQYLDNWAYQANIRKKVIRMAGNTSNPKPSPKIKTEMIAQVQDFAKKDLGLNPATVTADFPWDRFFEINAIVSSSPKFVIYQTEAERQRLAEEAARKKALQEKALKEAKEKNKAAPAPVPAS